MNVNLKTLPIVVTPVNIAAPPRAVVYLARAIAIVVFAAMALSLIVAAAFYIRLRVTNGFLTGGTYYTLLNEGRIQQLRSGERVYDHIRSLSRAIRTQGLGMRFSVRSGSAIDVGGPTRLFVNLLFSSLKQRVSSGATNDFISQPRTQVIIPQSEPVPDPRQTIFYDIGTIMALVYLHSQQPVIGAVFDDSIFSAIHSCLRGSEVDLPYDQLSDMSKLNMLRTLFQARTALGENFTDKMRVIDFLQRRPILTAQSFDGSDSAISAVKQFYEVAAYEVENDPFVEKNDLMTTLNVEAVLRDQIGFRQNLLNHLLQARTDSLGRLGSILFPIHTMAKAIKDTAGERWTEIRDHGSVYHSLQEANNRDPRIYFGRCMSEKVQGTLDRQKIVDRIKCFASQGIVKDQAQWIKDWILDPATPTEKVEGLLTVWTGSSTATGDLLVFSGGASLLPRVSTCMSTLFVSSQQTPADDPCPQHNRDIHGYKEVLNEFLLHVTTFDTA